LADNLQTTQDRDSTAGGYQIDGRGGANRGEEVAGLIAQIVRRDVETRRARANVRSRRHIPILVVIFIALTGFGAWNFLRITEPAAIPQDQSEAAARARLYLISSSLDAYRLERGRLPATLVEAGLDANGVSYNIESGRYTLVAQYGNVRVTYQEGQDKAPFAAAMRPGGRT
jgi:hypothetical protein